LGQSAGVMKRVVSIRKRNMAQRVSTDKGSHLMSISSDILSPNELESIRSAEFAQMIRQVIDYEGTIWKGPERRSFDRRPYPQLIRLTPITEQEWNSPQSPLYVVGRNLALQGLDFFHVEPIPFRFAVVSLQRDEDQMLHVLLRLSWCRFLQPGWYHSGGPFIRIMNSAQSRPLWNSSDL
jgi:hypothetical protein